jgi:hypothetical protein
VGTGRATERQGIPIQPVAVKAPLRVLQPITLEPVSSVDRPVWTATMATYHPWGIGGPLVRAKADKN